MAAGSVFERYARGEDVPLGWYAGFVLAYNSALAATVYELHRAGRLPEGIEARDLALLALATHRLSALVASDKVTSPIRAAFTELEGPKGTGAVAEKARGTGIQKALGGLLSCKYCTAPWIATALTASLAAAPRPTRFVASIFATVALSDYLHGFESLLKRVAGTAKAPLAERPGLAPVP